MSGLWNLASLQELINVKCGLGCTWSWDRPPGVGKIVCSSQGCGAFKTHFRMLIYFFQMTSLQNACPDRGHPSSAGDSKVWWEEGSLCSQTSVDSGVSSIFTDWVTLEKPVLLALSADWRQDLEEWLQVLGVGQENNLTLLWWVSLWDDIHSFSSFKIFVMKEILQFWQFQNKQTYNLFFIQ